MHSTMLSFLTVFMTMALSINAMSAQTGVLAALAVFTGITSSVLAAPLTNAPTSDLISGPEPAEIFNSSVPWYDLPIVPNAYQGNVTMDPAGPAALEKRATIGHAAFQNFCGFNVWINVCWQPGPGISAGCTPDIFVPHSGGRYAENFWNRYNNGRSIKISPIRGNIQKSVLQLEYTVSNPTTVWYDVSEVDGNPFHAHAFDLWNNNPADFHVHCRQNEPCAGVFPPGNPTGGTPYPENIANSFGIRMCVPN